MHSHIFERAKAAVDLRTLVHLKGQTSHHDYNTGVCPFHIDEKPSLLVYRDGWRCLAASCPRPKGSALDWIAYQRGILSPTGRDLYTIAKELVGGEADDVVLWNSDTADDIPNYFREDSISYAAVDRYSSLLDAEALDYLAGRGFSQEFISWNRWGWTGDSIVLPIWEGIPGESSVLTFRFRRLGGELRYYGLKGRNMPMLFNAWVRDYAVVHDLPKIYVMYGELDAALASQMCVPAISPTNGCRAFKKEWLNGYTGTVVFVPDKGEEDSAFRDANEFGLFGDVQMLPNGMMGKDFTEICQNHGQEWLHIFRTEPMFSTLWGDTCQK